MNKATTQRRTKSGKITRDVIMGWDSLAKIKQTLDDRSFKSIKLDGNQMTVPLIEGEHTFLKIIYEADRQDSLKNYFDSNTSYLITINRDWTEFTFTKKYLDTRGRLRYEPVVISKDNISPVTVNALDSTLNYDDIKNFDKLFDMADYVVRNLKYTLKSAVNKLSAAERRSVSDSLGFSTKENAKSDVHAYDSPATRALLVVASASLFHARMADSMREMKPDVDDRTQKTFSGSWPPQSLSQCAETENVCVALLESWNLILAVDYRPIFETARTVLSSINSRRVIDAIQEIVMWALDAVEKVEKMRHDILGRVFHKVLEDARHDGSYYTSVPSAVLLSHLAVQKEDIPKKLEDMRIIDPACGTGTLLMAVTERIRDLLGKKHEPKTMIENTLCGIDINKTALHMAATTLGLMSPTTKFKKMDIRQITLGLDEDSNLVSAGSLELYDDGGLFPHFNWMENKIAKQMDSGEKRASREYQHSADLVIMNPPFTRNDLRHDQLGKDMEKQVKAREADLFKNISFKMDRTSSGIMFLALAEKLCKRDTGTVACVFPLNVATAPSADGLRKFLACKFDIEYIVVSHHPTRFWFSENTSIAETLIIMRRKSEHGKKFTCVVNLADSPQNVTSAQILANDIKSRNDRDDVKYVDIPEKFMLNGDWYGVQFFSPYLTDVLFKIKNNQIFKHQTTLKDIVTIHRLRNDFRQSDTPDKHKWRSIWNHKTSLITSMEQEPYTYVIPYSKNTVKKSENQWNRRSTLLFPERLRSNLTHVTVIQSTIPTVSASWYSAVINDNIFDEKILSEEVKIKISKALTAYFNSTLGIISLLGIRIPKTPQYPRFSVDGISDTPVPKMTQNNLDDLETVHNAQGRQLIGRWCDANDPVRMTLDNIVAKTFDLDSKRLTKIRHELSKEPMCIGNTTTESEEDNFIE